jgi:SEC-C motif-containing protein
MAKGLTAEELSEQGLQWVSLEVLGSGVRDKQGWVEFKATYREEGKTRVLHEKSVFTLNGDSWLYIGGEIAPA